VICHTPKKNLPGVFCHAQKELAFVIFHLQKNETYLGDWSYKKRLAWVIGHTQQKLAWVIGHAQKNLSG
jgi:hypothetical protein